MELSILDFEVDYSLIGIHSAEEDYRLAYLLNKYLQTKLIRSDKVLDFKNSDVKFPFFMYCEKSSYLNYYFINNKYTHFIKFENEGLFKGNDTVSYLIPEKKNIDYFLKIEGSTDQKFTQNIIEQLKRINQIITSYSIEPSTLKSKDNLII